MRGAIERALLTEEPMEAARVARWMGVTVRTLRRRLSQEGTSYSALRRQALHARAKLLLAAGRESIDAIAARMGFADASSFSRAFRAWSGASPLAYRRKTAVR